MAQQSNRPDAEQFGGISDDQYLYPPTAPDEVQRYTDTPNVPPEIHHDTYNARPSDYLDFIHAGSPRATFDDKPSESFTQLPAKTAQVLRARNIGVVIGGYVLVVQGPGLLMGWSLPGLDFANFGPLFRDGIDLSGQPLAQAYNGQEYLNTGIWFRQGLCVDMSQITGTAATTDNALIVYTLENVVL